MAKRPEGSFDPGTKTRGEAPSTMTLDEDEFDRGGRMRRTLATKVLPAMGAGLLVALVVPGFAAADTLDAYEKGVLPDSVGFNSLWVIVAGMVVMFMQAGFAFLEIGFSRQKNAGTVVAKILTNFSIAAVCWYFVGYALAFGNDAVGIHGLVGGTGFLLQGFGDPGTAFPIMK